MYCCTHQRMITGSFSHLIPKLRSMIDCKASVSEEQPHVLCSSKTPDLIYCQDSYESKVDNVSHDF